jgi:hypothetical protein
MQIPEPYTVTGHLGKVYRLWIALLVVCALGCARQQPQAGNYSGRFEWQDGLKKLSLALDSDGRQTLDLRNPEVRQQIEAMIQEQVKRANLTAAQGNITISILGNSPFLISLHRFEIQAPDFSELRQYVETQNLDGLKRFIGRYHDVNQRELPGQNTALFYAALQPDVKPLQALLALGADPNIPDFQGDTPLIAAVMGDREEAARQLIRAGADVNHSDQAGGTPLMRAVELGRFKLLTLLLQSGANPNYVAPHGESALQLARDMGDQAAMAALQHAGASR